jgi:hypothetical protein
MASNSNFAHKVNISVGPTARRLDERAHDRQIATRRHH